MKTVAQQIKWDFKTNGVLDIRDKNSNLIYHEDSNRDWSKFEMDSQGKLIYWENSRGYWEKQEWDSQGNRIYYENSFGEIIDNRHKPCENKEIVIDGVKYKLTKV